MADALILSKVRQALKAYIEGLAIAELDGVNLYDGKGSSEKESDCIIFSATEASEDPPGTGNYWVEAEIALKTMAAVNAGEAVTDPHTASEAKAAALWNALQVTDLPILLSAAVDDFTCFGVGEDSRHEQGEDGDCFRETMRMRLYCCTRGF